MRTARYFALILVAACLGCSYRPYAGPLEPSPEAAQGESMAVADDGSITYTHGRLEVKLRRLTDDELNRQFGGRMSSGPQATNPYTYSDREDFYTGEKPERFTVFKLSLKNYEYPKVRLDGDVVLESDNGRKYYSLSLQQMDRYFRAYAVGYRGIEYNVYKERRAILLNTAFPREDIFSGQETEGLIVFRPLDEDVAQMTVTVRDLVIRFDFRGEPAESLDVSYRFERDVGRRYPDGTIELHADT